MIVQDWIQQASAQGQSHIRHVRDNSVPGEDLKKTRQESIGRAFTIAVFSPQPRDCLQCQSLRHFLNTGHCAACKPGKPRE